ncbi:MAG: hydrolase [Planctomycetota bacterium]|jgi:nicotinamidase-related amidase
MLDSQNCCLVVIDVQGKLAQLMHEKDSLFKNIEILIKGCKILDIPVIWTQQVPKALGQTIDRIAGLLTDLQPINKASFSCCGQKEFIDTLNEKNRKHILICGIETHICVYQTAIELLDKDFQVHVVADAVSSRAMHNKQISLQKIHSFKAQITTTEMLLFELVKTAEHPKFRQIAKLVK